MANRAKKALSAAAALILCVTLLCSFLSVAWLADHDCDHSDNCAVCRVIADCVKTIRGTLTGTAAAAVFSAAAVTVLAVLCVSAFCKTNGTLVSLKVELLN